MSKRMVMKGVLGIAVLMATLCFTSCSDDPIETVTADTDASLSRRAYSDDQTKIQRLGFAYNAAGNVMDDGSFSQSPIINMDRLKAAEAKYGLIISSEHLHR